MLLRADRAVPRSQRRSRRRIPRPARTLS